MHKMNSFKTSFAVKVIDYADKSGNRAMRLTFDILKIFMV